MVCGVSVEGGIELTIVYGCPSISLNGLFHTWGLEELSTPLTRSKSAQVKSRSIRYVWPGFSHQRPRLVSSTEKYTGYKLDQA